MYNFSPDYIGHFLDWLEKKLITKKWVQKYLGEGTLAGFQVLFVIVVVLLFGASLENRDVLLFYNLFHCSTFPCHLNAITLYRHFFQPSTMSNCIKI